MYLKEYLKEIARKIVLKTKLQRYLCSARDVITVKPTDNLDYCMELMSTKRIRHLPVLENNAVLGVISIDVVKSIIETKRNNSVFGLLY
jgi:predicted transcriptional regulator